MSACSVGCRVARTARSGSTISYRSGPTPIADVSDPRRREPRTVHWSVPRHTPPAASNTPRFVYFPRPNTTWSDASRAWAIIHTFSVHEGSGLPTLAKVSTTWCVRVSSAATSGPWLALMARSGRSEDRSGFLLGDDLVPVPPELEQDLLGVLAVLGRRGEAVRLLVEHDRVRDQREGHAIGPLDVDDVAVRAGLRVVVQLERGLHRCPHTLHAGERLAPLLERLRPDRLVEDP